MAQSYLEFAGRGAGPYPVHRLPFLDAAYLSATIDGTPVAITVDVANRLVTLASSAGAGTVVRIQRTTPRDQDDRLTQFLDLPSGEPGLTADLLDQDYRQILHVIGEGRDVGEGAEPEDGMLQGADGNWDALGLRVEGAAPGSSPQDGVTKAQLDAVDGVDGDLPAVTAGENDYGLFVAAGAWAARSPTQSRAHLGLGTAATLALGAAAGNVARFDSSARYPTADGTIIDITAHPDLDMLATGTVVRWGGLSDIGAPALDVSLATWTQNSASRMALQGAWGGRVELNNSGDVDGSSGAPRRIAISAGTWRISWVFRATFPTVNNVTNATSLRLTNDDDTSAQVIYYDMGIHRPNTDFSGTDYSVFTDTVLLTFASSAFVVFRYANVFSGGSNKCQFACLFHKVSAP